QGGEAGEPGEPLSVPCSRLPASPDLERDLEGGPDCTDGERFTRVTSLTTWLFRVLNPRKACCPGRLLRPPPRWPCWPRLPGAGLALHLIPPWSATPSARSSRTSCGCAPGGNAASPSTPWGRPRQSPHGWSCLRGRCPPGWNRPAPWPRSAGSEHP